MSSLDRIAALLAKAERSDNEHEAEAFLAKAQSLATVHSVDLAVARARIAHRERREQPTTKVVRIGEPGKRANRWLVMLFLAIADCNDVRCDIARNSTSVWPFGFPSDIEVVEMMWASVATQMTVAANAWLATGEWRTETYRARTKAGWDRYGRTVWGYQTKPHTATTARAAFYQAYIPRIRQRLMAAREAAIAAASAVAVGAEDSYPDVLDLRDGADRPRAVSAALVLKGKAEEVAAYYRQASEASGSWRGYGGSVLATPGAASRAGTAAAERARLTSQRGIAGPAGDLPAG
ncbi:MAG: DUF2786 domain-containing protein [Candidatus Nanopelagicales bacterium]